MIHHPTTNAAIPATFDIIQPLRPALTRETYVARTRQLTASDGSG